MVIDQEFQLISMNRRCIGVGDETATAAGFVHAFAPNRDAFFGLKSALGVVGGLAALHADGVGLGDVLSDGKKLRHRLPGLAGVVLIEAGDNHPDAALSQSIGHADQFVIEKLPLINANYFGVRFDF